MKIELEIVRLHFTTPLHISNPRSDYARSETLIHSDALTASIMQAWASLGKPEWISDNHGFAVSGLFPFLSGNGRYFYFLPKPVKDKLPEKIPAELIKKFRKTRFYQKEIFEKRLFGKLNVVKNEQFKGDYLCDPESFKVDKLRIVSSTVTPRIMRPRNPAENSVPFYMEKLYFYSNTGLFFILITDNETERNRFIQALVFLSENGIGSDRSVGNGRFEFSLDKIEINCPDESEYFISLSAFIPESEMDLIDMIGEHTSYDIMRRGGWISEPYNTLRKRTVHMLVPGSVLRINGKEYLVKGKVTDLKPLNIQTHNAIYRSGKSIFLPIKPE
ncbi:MAG: type III-A CRISPR-associated RAMP protein Csm4 [Bacteroidales bacterium]|nr:type III-A CRISPR-associated RAMP protein Csm4 [Bacteroidales bacterium]